MFKCSNFSVNSVWKMWFSPKWSTVLWFLFCLVQSAHLTVVFFTGGPPFCLNQDVNGGVCGIIENFFAFPPFQQAVDLLASSLTGFTTIIQIQEVLDYVTQSFGPNPLNTTDYESMSHSFNLFLFQPWVSIYFIAILVLPNCMLKTFALVLFLFRFFV